MRRGRRVTALASTKTGAWRSLSHAPVRFSRLEVGVARAYSLPRRRGARSMSKSISSRTRTAGHRAAASVAQDGQPHGAPLVRRYFNAHAAAPYLCSRSGEPFGSTAGLTQASQPRRQQVRIPEAGPLASARLRRAGFRPSVLRAQLRRRDPPSREADGLQLASSWTRDGLKSKASSNRGDKFCGRRRCNRN
jgi:hypothetical protein